MGLSTADRFWAKVEKGIRGECWLWFGTRNASGYGQFRSSPTERKFAHRFAYEMLVGPIPDGLQLDHLCRVRHCVNPDHLEPVTPRENSLRGTSFAASNSRKTHCIHGHEFTPENTILRPNGKGRDCRTCGRKRYLAYYYKRRAVA